MEGITIINYQDWLQRRREYKSSLRENNNPFKDLNAEYEQQSSGHSAQRVQNVTSGIETYNGPWTDWEKRHLIRRTSFGCRPQDMAALSDKSLNDAVELILNNEEPMPAPPVNWYQDTFPDENGLPFGEDWTRDAIPTYIEGAFTNYYRSESLKLWLLHQCLNKSLSIREKMVHFWYHFIPVNFDDVLESQNLYCATNSARICYDYMQMFRENAMGNYKSIIRNVATQPAMMYYLNNQANAATAPDENFAREVMELFTLGNNMGTTYTQNDVIQAAKLLSGWRVQNLNTTYPSATFVPYLHDYSTKQFSAFFDHQQIAGTGASELDAFIDMLFSRQTIVAEHLCRRLYRYFIYYDIDASVEENFIQPLADVLIQNNWNVQPVLRVMFKSQHFFDMANRGVMIKSPLDFLAGNMRDMNLQFNVSDTTNIVAQYQLLYILQEQLFRPQAYVIGEVPNVSGWSAYYQKPSYYQFWINSNTLQQRYRFLQAMFSGFSMELNKLIVQMKYDEFQFISQFPNSVRRDPTALVDNFIKTLLPVDFSGNTKTAIRDSTLLSQLDNPSYWTLAWDALQQQPNNENVKNQISFRLKSLLAHLMQLAEFHLT